MQLLVTATLESGAFAACARVCGQLQPMFALVKTSTVDQLASAISAGERAMHRWLESLNAVAVDFDDPRAFVNVNTMPDTGQRVA